MRVRSLNDSLLAQRIGWAPAAVHEQLHGEAQLRGRGHQLARERDTLGGGMRDTRLGGGAC